MLTRRHFLYALTGSALSLAGCKGKPSIPGDAPTAVPISTIIDPKDAEAAAFLTRHPLRFADVSGPAGLTWKFSNGAAGKHHFIETTGGGVAFFDFNNDGRLDIFALQGGPVPGTGDTSTPTRSVLYRNNGDGTFTDVTAMSGLDVNFGYGQGVSVADYDNDGWPDLYVSAYGGNHLMHNNRNGTWTDVTKAAGLADLRSGVAGELPWPLSAAWGDYDGDGRLDLFVCHYARWTAALDKPYAGADGKMAYDKPQVYEPSFSRLYHNNGDGTFTDVSHKAGMDRLQGKSMSAVWLDYDDDGWPDLFVTNDSMPNFLLHNNRDGTFTDKGVVSGVALDDQGRPASGMGIGAGDYDHDGREDLFVVNFAGQPKSVFHNLGGGVFESTSYKSGVASTNLQFLGFSMEAFDYDLDGNVDLIFGNGHVLDKMDESTAGSSYAQSQQLFHNAGGGTFAEDRRSLGDLALPRVTRGLAVGDFDNDGDWDVVMVSQTGPLQLYRNDGGNANGWLTLRLEGVQANRDALGAKVTVLTKAGRRTQWVHGSTSYLSHSDTRVTFGLGGEAGILGGEVRWPGGETQKFGPLSAGGFYWLREGSGPVKDPRVRKR